jgi:hypothetical protein
MSVVRLGRNRGGVTRYRSSTMKDVGVCVTGGGRQRVLLVWMRAGDGLQERRVVLT